jgi:hypothetical protein
MFISATLTEFLGWSLVINSAVLLLVSLMLIAMRAPIAKLHDKMFDLSDADLSRAYFQYLGQYKLLIIVFNLTPYLALKLMA